MIQLQELEVGRDAGTPAQDPAVWTEKLEGRNNYVNSIKEITKGQFNNYVNKILTFLDHPPTPSKQAK